MSLIDTSARSARTAAAKIGPAEIVKAVTEFVKKQFGDDAWEYFRLHQNDVLFTLHIDKKIWFYTVHIDYPVKIAEARWFLEQLVGPEIVPASGSAPVT